MLTHVRRTEYSAKLSKMFQTVSLLFYWLFRQFLFYLIGYSSSFFFILLAIQTVSFLFYWLFRPFLFNFIGYFICPRLTTSLRHLQKNRYFQATVHFGSIIINGCNFLFHFCFPCAFSLLQPLFCYLWWKFTNIN